MSIDGKPRLTGLHLTRPIELTCIALCMAQAFYLAFSFYFGSWLLDPGGHAIATDFVNVWAGGRHVLDGNPTAAYDVAIHKQAEEAAVGHSFDGEYPWLYPPTFFFAATLLALLPFVVAHAAWVLLTFPAYVAAVRGIVGHRAGVLFACAFPGILANFMAGQNGFVTAGLLGGALLVMQRRPLLSGCLIGLLSFKPHLGVLIPLVLIAGGHWRVLAAAAVVVLLLVAASWLAFGGGAWEAFFHALPAGSQATLTDGRADWAKLQSVFALTRLLGGSEGLAFVLHGSIAAAIAVLLCAMWRSDLSFDLKAAALATGTLLATPYLYLYDLVVLAIPIAFLVRASVRSGDMPNEMLRLAAPCLLIFIFPLVMAPVGLAAVILVACLIARRVVLKHEAPDAPGRLRWSGS